MERNGSTATFVNVLIVTDSQHSLEIFRVGGGGLWQYEERRRATKDFLPFFSSSLCILSLSFPGRGGSLTGSQTEDERMISFRTLGAFFCKHCLILCRPLWGREWGGGCVWGGYNSCTV